MARKRCGHGNWRRATPAPQLDETSSSEEEALPTRTDTWRERQQKERQIFVDAPRITAGETSSSSEPETAPQPVVPTLSTRYSRNFERQTFPRNVVQYMRKLSNRPPLPVALRPARIHHAVVISEPFNSDKPPRDIREVFAGDTALADTKHIRHLFTKTQFLSLEQYRQRQVAQREKKEEASTLVTENDTNHDLEITLQVTPERTVTAETTSPQLSLFGSDDFGDEDYLLDAQPGDGRLIIDEDHLPSPAPGTVQSYECTTVPLAKEQCEHLSTNDNGGQSEREKTPVFSENPQIATPINSPMKIGHCVQRSRVDVNSLPPEEATEFIEKCKSKCC